VGLNDWETRLSVIAMRYMRGWFLMDLASIFPSAFDIIPVIDNEVNGLCTGDVGSLDRDRSPLASLRIVRAFRLLKLVRLVKTPFALLKRLVIRIATPRATVTVVSLLLECVFVSHMKACVLGMVSTFSASQLHTWMATLGYCRPGNATRSDGTPEAECVDPAYMYLQCLWWSVGMLMGAPISMTPDKGPYPRYYFDSANEINLRPGEQCIIIVLKFIAAFHWSTVIARFVFVFNNLDTEQKEFQLGWDALNNFCSFFKIQRDLAIQLRQYYLERNKEMRARSRRKVLSKFSPKLAEDVVWELDKSWLVRVPVFSLCAERLSGDELRFFVRVALAMDVSVFVPKDRPPPRRLYIITQGVALYKGQQLGTGMSWGAEDVLLFDKKNVSRLRAYAMTYLHVQWLDANVIQSLKEEFPRAHLLCRFWTMMHAVGDFLIDNLRRTKMKINPLVLPAEELQQRLANRLIKVEPTGQRTEEGEKMAIVSRYVDQGSLEIIKDKKTGNFKVVEQADGDGLSPTRPLLPSDLRGTNSHEDMGRNGDMGGCVASLQV